MLKYQRSRSTRAFICSILTVSPRKPFTWAPPRDSGLDVIAKGVFRQNFRIFVIVGQFMRPRTDKGHVAEQNVEQLRQLVDAGLTQNAPETGPPWIVPLGLQDHNAVIHHRHGAKFVDPEWAGIKALRRCLNGTGPGESNLMVNAVRTNSGANTTRPVDAPMTS